MDGADRRKMVVAAGASAGGYEVWYRRYADSTMGYGETAY